MVQRPPDISTDLQFLAEQKARAAARAARFAAEASSPPPPLPTRSMAWPGGKLTHNKEDAVRKFIERKRASDDGLSREAERTLIASLRARESTPTLSPDASGDGGAGRASGGGGADVERRPARAVQPTMRKRRRTSSMRSLLLTTKASSRSRLRCSTVRAFFGRPRKLRVRGVR